MISHRTIASKVPSSPPIHDGPVPLYFRIQTEIRKKIESGVWLPGDMIPSENQIAEGYNVSLGTVRRAIQDLVATGLLYTMQGKGTMVAGTNVKREALRYYRFKEDFAGKEISHSITLLNLEKTSPRPGINGYLKVSADMDLYLIKRVFSSSGKPIVYSISYLPEKMLPGLENLSRHRIERVPLYLSLENKYGIPTKENEELIEVAPADSEASAVLNVAEGSPLLRIEMLSYTHRKKPYEYRISWCASKTYKLVRSY